MVGEFQSSNNKLAIIAQKMLFKSIKYNSSSSAIVTDFQINYFDLKWKIFNPGSFSISFVSWLYETKAVMRINLD